MSPPKPAAIACALGLCIAGCQRGTPVIAAPGPASRPSGDAAVAYRCSNGASLRVRYSDNHADLRWPDGRTLALPRAQSASKGGGDVYVGDTVALQRDDSHLRLHDGDAPAVACEQHDAP